MTSEIPAPHPTGTPTRPTADSAGAPRLGWVLLAGLFLIMMAVLQVIIGVVSFTNDGTYPVTRAGLLVENGYSAWGWIHTVIGFVAGAAGVAIILGRAWARVAGILLASVSTLVNVAFLDAYPICGVLVITLDVIVIYGLVVHGRDDG